MELNDAMITTKADLAMLKQLSKQYILGPLASDDEIKRVQRLAGMGLVRDYGNWFERRIPIRLRIWGISPGGRAVLEQQALTERQGRQLVLTARDKEK